MADYEEFGGDVLLMDTADGGEINIVNGLVMSDKRFSTATFLSLFGGNPEDEGKVDNSKTWWGNRFQDTSEVEKLSGKFQSVIKTLPMTSKNLRVAEGAARDDLQWFIDEGIADDIVCSLRAVDVKRIEITVVIKKSGELIEKGNWTANWEAVNNGV